MTAVDDPPTIRGDAAAVRAARSVPRRRHGVVLATLVCSTLAAFTIRVLLGDYPISFVDFFRIVDGADIPVASFVLMEDKLPRALLALMAGMAFGIGGSVFQTTLRNPLASPDIIGISMGASFAGLFAMLILDLGGLWVSVAALIGAVVIVVVIRLVAGDTSGYRLVLIGIGLSAALGAGTQYLLTRASIRSASQGLRWLTGSISNADWQTVGILACFLVAMVPILLWLSRSLRITELGQDAAEGLGVRPSRTDLLMLVAALMVAAGVAAAGPVAFVSFLAGPTARALNAGRTSIVGAGLVGAVVMLGADHLAAYHLGAVSYPVGVVTGALGAPFLLWLIASGRTGRRSG